MTFLGLNAIFLAISILVYFLFRCGVDSYCVLKKMSKTFRRKHKKGWANRWLYVEIHQLRSLGMLYYFNYIFLISLAAFALMLPLSLIPLLRLPLLIIVVLFGLFQAVVLFQVMIYTNREEYGTAVIIFARRKTPRGFSTIFDWIFCLFPLVIYFIFLIRFNL